MAMLVGPPWELVAGQFGRNASRRGKTGARPAASGHRRSVSAVEGDNEGQAYGRRDGCLAGRARMNGVTTCSRSAENSLSLVPRITTSQGLSSQRSLAPKAMRRSRSNGPSRSTPQAPSRASSTGSAPEHSSIDLAVIRLRSGALDAAAATLEPALALAPAQRIASLNDRIRTVLTELAAPVFRRSVRARELADQIDEFSRDSVIADLDALPVSLI
jgi:hypothetical protein